MPSPTPLPGYPLPMFRSDVSGVPTMWAEAEEPFSATLSFRVGRADETMLTSGITHLVEHLAMPAHARHLFEVNARVEGVRTMFWAHGKRDEVLDFLRSVASALADLPMHRLDAERRILRAEGGSFQSTVYSTLLWARYGAQSLGLYDYPEWGLHRLDADDVRGWAAAHFTADNAVLWLTGPPPDDFELGLPRGSRRPPPPFPESAFGLPLRINWGSLGISFSSTLRRSVVSLITAELVRNRIHHELRYTHGISYAARLDYDPLDAEVAHVFVSSDALEGQEQLACDEVVRALESLATDGPTGEELEYEQRLAERVAADPQEIRNWLHRVADNELLGGKATSAESFTAAVAEIVAGDVASVATELLENMVFCVPHDLSFESERFPEARGWDDPVVSGKKFRPRRWPPWKPAAAELVVGPEGISITDSDGTGTIRFADAAGVVRHDNGTVVVHRLDGRWLNLQPVSEWPFGEAALATLASVVPPELAIDESD